MGYWTKKKRAVVRNTTRPIRVAIVNLVGLQAQAGPGPGPSTSSSDRSLVISALLACILVFM